MAEETPMNPISEAVPPKANPLASPATAHASTLKLNPVVRRPGAAGATQTTLKPGLKLPPKPTLGAGIKLPPKPGATVPGLKPGIRLPSQAGLKPGIKLPTQSGLKPGVKLPTRPVIHKLGTPLATPTPTATAKPIVTPVAKPEAKPVASTVVAKLPDEKTPVAEMTPVEMTPVADVPPVEQAPVAEPPKAAESAPVAAPAPAPTPAPAHAPVAAADAPKSEQPKPLDVLKTITQNLKNITSPIPQQAILRKTGIIADAEMTEAQKQAAKSKTARISLSDAMGVAPVKNEALPMKTIRIKRPVDIPSSSASHPTAPAKPVLPPTEPAKAAESQAETKPVVASTAASSAAATSFTQRKTLKISRPGGGVVRPTGKFGVKKPAMSTSAKTVVSSVTTPSAAAGSGDAATMTTVPEIPDMPTVSTVVPPMPVASKDQVPDVPKGLATLSVIIEIAACVAMAFLGWLLFQDTQLPLYCGGCL